MKVLSYFECENKEKWIPKIRECDWGAAKFLADLLEKNTFSEVLDGELYILADNENIVSFCTLTKKDCIDDNTLYPWIGFVYTHNNYRGNRYSKEVIDYACKRAEKMGYDTIYLATDHIGFYEKYGFEYIESRTDIYNEQSRIYKKNLKKSRLYIVEGMPCSGKSTTSKYIASLFENSLFVDEGTNAHPADFEFDAFLSADELSAFSEKEKSHILSISEPFYNGYVIPLCKCEGELFDRLLNHKIYDFLPWETQRAVILRKWESFVKNADFSKTYVFNCVFLQNPMCETMMRFNLSKEESLSFINEIYSIIKPLNPVVVYLRNDNIKSSVLRTSAERDGWLEGVIDYHINGEFGKSINAKGLDGYIECLNERQRRELEILSQLDIKSVIIKNAHNDWQGAYEKIKNSI